MNEIGLIALVAIGLAVVSVLIHKLLVNEKLVNNSRDEMKELQKKIKETDPKGKDFKKLQDRILELNMSVMKEQFKPMFITFLPYILVFYFLSASFNFVPMVEGSVVNLDLFGEGEVMIDCLGVEEVIDGRFSEKSEIQSESCTLFYGEKEYDFQLGEKQDIETFEFEDLKIVITPPKKVFINLPFSIPFVGNELGWLGTFIIFSFAASTILNKSLKKVYLRKWE